MEDETELRIPVFKAPPNIFFVYYDDEGNITDITNEKKVSGNFLEKSYKDVVEFLDGKKQLSNFQIKILEGKTKIFQKTKLKLVYKDLIILPENSKAECVVQICSQHIELKTDAKLDNDQRILKFFIVDTKNLNFLIKTINVSLHDLCLGKKVVFQFDVKKHRIVTKKFFSSYGIIYND